MPAQHSPTHTNVSSAQWHILGIGAIGTLFAFYLQERAHLIVNANSPYAKQNTLTLHLQKHTITSTASFSCNTAAQANNIQRLLICTKAHQTEQALEGLHLADATQIVLLQNGLGNHSLLKKRFPQCSIFCGTT